MSDSDTHREPTLLGALIRIIVALIALVLAGLVVVFQLNLGEQFWFAVVLFAVGLILTRIPGRLVTFILIFLSIIISARYLHWRASATLLLDSWVGVTLGATLLLAELYAVMVMVIGYMQSAWPLRRKPVPLPEDPDTWPSVDVMIPTYNESLDVVRATVMAAQSIDWPPDQLEIWLLDDGRRPEFQAFAAAAGVHYVTRPDNKHAKAGNINNALEQASGEFVAIFDCDHTPTRAFLQMVMGAMIRDPKLAMAQTPHHFNTPDPFEKNLEVHHTVPPEGDLFYGLLLPGNDTYNSVFFCGSCAVIRREALDEVGGIAVETVTEDAHTGLRLHRRGWRTAYFNIPLASGLATESISGHIGQRIRWARGMVQVFRTDNPLLGRGLSPVQRITYTQAMVHFLNAIPRLIFLMAPMAFLLGGINIFAASGLMVAAYVLPHLMHAVMTSSRIQGRYRHSFWSEVYEATLALYILVPTTLALISPKLGKFNVTAKGGLVEEDYYDRKIARPWIALFLLNLVGVGFAIWRLWRGEDPTDAVIINLVWTIYNLIVLGACLSVAYEMRQRRQTNRLSLRLPGLLRLPTGHTATCETVDLSRGGAMISCDGSRALEKGQTIHLCLLLGEEEVSLPATVVQGRAGMARLRFEDLELREEAGLVRAIYSRADAWYGWNDTIREDRPLLSYARIVRQSVRGVPRLLLGRAGRDD